MIVYYLMRMNYLYLIEKCKIILLKCNFKAGVWGCGTWAYKDKYSIGTSTSGCGEHLVRTSLARTVADAISDSSCPTTSLHNAMKVDFIGENP